ncbi:MAG TPA: LssY C-terminal domain-containing protein [Candidatus Saccharimonadales bacterium]|nr:LssY C-terminal domain-containing protein [Candidatus Saccharimonadales bacterium]
MLHYGLVVLKRLLVLALIVGLAWFTLFKFFPAVDAKVPFLLAIIITYAFLAYVALPALLRVRHLIQPPTHVPTRTIASDGWAVDAINIVVLARSERDFTWAMQKAGWLPADTLTIKTRAKMVLAVMLNRSYPTAPFGNYYVFGRKQDLGFQIPVGRSPRHRHHVRFWRLGTTLLEDEHEHHGFWRKLLKKFLTRKKEVWVGAAILDAGLNVRFRNLQIDHGIEDDTTIERDFLVGSLKDANVLKDKINIKAGEPLHTRHQGFGEEIIADGYVALCELKRQLLPPAGYGEPTQGKRQ